MCLTKLPVRAHLQLGPLSGRRDRQVESRGPWEWCGKARLAPLGFDDTHIRPADHRIDPLVSIGAGRQLDSEWCLVRGLVDEILLAVFVKAIASA